MDTQSNLSTSVVMDVLPVIWFQSKNAYIDNYFVNEVIPYQTKELEFAHD